MPNAMYTEYVDKLLFSCCKQAVTFINSLGITTTVSGKTVGDWHRHFRKNDKFPHPNPHVQMGKKPTREVDHFGSILKEKAEEWWQ